MSRAPVLTSLQQSAFWRLGVGVRDGRQRIVQAAEDRSLEFDPELCQKLRTELTTPRTRLSAEMGWLPGLSPRKANQLVTTFFVDETARKVEPGLPALARANLLAALCEVTDPDESHDTVAALIRELGTVSSELDANAVLREINEDRAVAGFPEVRGVETIQSELSERKRHFRNSIRSMLDRALSVAVVKIVTQVVTEETDSGDQHAPELIDDLVDSYELEAQGFLDSEGDNIAKLTEVAREVAKAGEAELTPVIDRLESVLRNWDWVAQPIQLSAKARGIDHERSKRVGLMVRSLAVDLYNEHSMMGSAQRLTNLLAEVLSEVPELQETVSGDSAALEDLARQKQEADEQTRQWAEAITFSADVGLVNVAKLELAPTGVSWNGIHFPLEAVSRVRWGGMRHSINGIPTGTTYTVAFGDPHTEAVVTMRKEQVFSPFVEKLWRAVGWRLAGRLLESLKGGGGFRFGTATVYDDGITLIQHRWIGTGEPRRYAWSEVQTRSQDGSFHIGSQDKKASVVLSYINIANVHILEHVIGIAFKRGAHRLSQVLDDE